MLPKTVVPILMPLLLAACAAPMRVSMTPEQRNKISEVKTHVIVPQDEVIAAVQPSAASFAGIGAGLLGVTIGAMIDASVMSRRVNETQKLMGPLYANIEDVDYRAEFGDAMKQESASHSVKIGQVVTTPRLLNMAELNQFRKTLKPNEALLLLVPRYSLNMGFRNLDANSQVTVWLPGEGNAPVHHSFVRYQSQSVGEGGQGSMDLWSANNASLFRSTLHESASELTQMILMDIDMVAQPAGPSEMRNFSLATGGRQTEITGRVLKEDINRTVVLDKSGTLYSLPKPEVAALGQR